MERKKFRMGGFAGRVRLVQSCVGSELCSGTSVCVSFPVTLVLLIALSHVVEPSEPNSPLKGQG